MSAGAARRRDSKKFEHYSQIERGFRAHIKNKKYPVVEPAPYKSVNKKKKKP